MKPPFIPKLHDLSWLIEPQIRPCGGPIFFAESLTSWTGDNILHNGSFGLVDTGKMKLLVTCRHVWDEFQILRRDSPGLNLCVCINPQLVITLGDARPIDEDKERDIASFDMGPFLTHCEQSKFFPLPHKSARVKMGDAIAFIGYPGRVDASTSIGVQFRRVFHTTFAYDVTKFTIIADVSNMKHVKRKSTEDACDEWGGISGSPCFVVRKSSSIELAGFATSVGMDQLRFTVATCLNSDGTIDRITPYSL